MPDLDALLVGGPFDGETHYFNPNDWQPDESRFTKLYDDGIIEPITLISVSFPEGAIYSWDNQKRNWQYQGIPSKEKQKEFQKLFKAFGIKPASSL